MRKTKYPLCFSSKSSFKCSSVSSGTRSHSSAAATNGSNNISNSYNRGNRGNRGNRANPGNRAKNAEEVPERGIEELEVLIGGVIVIELVEIMKV